MKPSLSSLKVHNILFQLNNVKPENSSTGSRPASACSRLMLPFQVTFANLEAKKLSNNQSSIHQSINHLFRIWGPPVHLSTLYSLCMLIINTRFCWSASSWSSWWEWCAEASWWRWLLVLLVHRKNHSEIILCLIQKSKWCKM